MKRAPVTAVSRAVPIVPEMNHADSVAEVRLG